MSKHFCRSALCIALAVFLILGVSVFTAAAEEQQQNLTLNVVSLVRTGDDGNYSYDTTGSRKYADIYNKEKNDGALTACISGNCTINQPLNISKPDNIIGKNKDGTGNELYTYECVGVIVDWQASEYGNISAKETQTLHSFIDNSVTISVTEDNALRWSTDWGDSGNEFRVAFIWENKGEAQLPTVTYDFKGNLTDKEDSLEYFPVVDNFRNVDTGNISDGMSSLAFITKGNKLGNLNEKNSNPQIDIENLTVPAPLGSTATFPKLEQLRSPVYGGRNAFYPVVGFIARVKTDEGYDYYELKGWTADANVSPAQIDGLYGEFTPSGSTVTLKANWEKIEPKDMADDAPTVPLLDTQNNGTLVKLEQKTTGNYTYGPATTGTDGKLDYRVTMGFSNVFESAEMPWMGQTAAFNEVNNPDFATLNIDVTIDENLKLAAGTDGFTTLKISNSSFDITAVKVDGTEISGNDNITGLSTSEVKVKFDEDTTKFTLVLKWKTHNSFDLTIEFPTEVKDNYAGPINGTTVKVTGTMDLSKSHSTTNGEKADFEVDQLVRYILALDENWNTYYMTDRTITNFVQAIHDLDQQLKNIDLQSNTLAATAPVQITDMTVEPVEVTINVGESTIPIVTITPDDADKSVTWAIEEGTDVVSVDSATGKITGIKPGTAKVKGTSVSDSTKSVEIVVTVNGIIYVEPTVGGTVTVDKTSAAVGDTVTITATASAGNSLTGGKPTVYYRNAERVKQTVEVTEANGTFTFTMPSESPVYISAIFAIVNESGNTVVGDSTTEVGTVNDQMNQYTGKANQIDVEMSQEALEEMLEAISEDVAGGDTEDALRQKLNDASVDTTNETIYRHVETRAHINVTNVDASGANGSHKLELDITFQYRVIASTKADPDDVETGENGKNAVVVSTGTDNGWVDYESTKPTYIVVPLPDSMGIEGEWIRATHMHGDTPYTQILQVRNDGTVVYTNDHEGFSPFTFEQIGGIKDIPIDNAGNNIDIDFMPETSTYSAQVGSEVESVQINPQFMVSEGANSLNGTLTLTVNGEEVTPVTVSGLPTFPEVKLSKNNAVNTVVLHYVSTRVDGSGNPAVDMTYTINITRGTYTPQPPTPAAYDVTVEADEHAAVEASASSARAGTEITVTVTPAEGYHVSGLTVTAANGSAVAVTDNGDGTYTFTMPASAVTVKAETFPCSATVFPDLDADEWYHEYTDYVVSEGIMNGDEGSFKPHDVLTRAELAQVLWNLSGQKDAGEDVLTFTDVKEGDWFYAAVQWASGEGIVNGYEDGSFKPDQAVTREELAVMLYRYAKSIGEEADPEYTIPATYTDVADIGDWALEAMSWCVQNGIINGRTATTIEPGATAERCEVAAMLTRYLRPAE